MEADVFECPHHELQLQQEGEDATVLVQAALGDNNVEWPVNLFRKPYLVHTALATPPLYTHGRTLLTLYLSSRQLSTSGALGANTSGRYLRAKDRLVACGVSPWRLYCSALLRMLLRTNGLSSSPGVCPAPS